MTCTYLAKRLRELSSTKTGSYPHEFLCRTNCSACADYQPWMMTITIEDQIMFLISHVNKLNWKKISFCYSKDLHSILYKSLVIVKFIIGQNLYLLFKKLGKLGKYSFSNRKDNSHIKFAKHLLKDYLNNQIEQYHIFI